MGFVKRKRKGNSKYVNKKVVNVDGTLSDSKLERVFYNGAKQRDIKFWSQIYIVLQEKFRAKNGNFIRAIRWKVDFIIPVGDKLYIVDTKGVMTEGAQIKNKMAIKILDDAGVDYEIKFIGGNVWRHKRKSLKPMTQFLNYAQEQQIEKGTGNYPDFGQYGFIQVALAKPKRSGNRSDVGGGESKDEEE